MLIKIYFLDCHIYNLQAYPLAFVYLLSDMKYYSRVRQNTDTFRYNTSITLVYYSDGIEIL